MKSKILNIPNKYLWPSCILSYIKHHRWQLIRFCIVGLTTFILNFFFVWLFYGRAKLDYRVAVSCAYCITVVVHFMLNRLFTYRQKDGAVFTETTKYLMMLFVNYFITLSVITVTVELLGLIPYYGVIFSAFSTGFSSFLLMKYFVFVRRADIK